jgi:hypothetical protein
LQDGRLLLIVARLLLLLLWVMILAVLHRAASCSLLERHESSIHRSIRPLMTSTPPTKGVPPHETP